MELNLQKEIERLFEEARRNTKAKHEEWKKYYNRRRRDVQIKRVTSKEFRIAIVHDKNRVVLTEYNRDQMSRSMTWLEIYANLQSPKTPKSISDKVLHRSVTIPSKKKTGFIRRSKMA
ncbi:hypothetical protein TNCV_3846531 [Trichonephila clavipes]|nr:hypothetical protein TNCV_3846531 [Trichonephila clavipes]